MSGQHRRPPRFLWLLKPTAALAAIFPTASFGMLWHGTWEQTAQPTPVAAPTAVDLPRETTGHGGPLTPPSIDADGKWEPADGPVISDGQALPQPVVTAAPVQTGAPAPTNGPSSPTKAATSPSSPPIAAAEPAPAPAPQQQGELVDLVNADRAANGCGPVTIADDLMTQAQTHSNGQAAADQMFHSTGVSGHDSWGENVAVGFDTAAEVHGAWLESTGHRANIMNCRFTLIGYAFADGDSGRYWTEMFAAS